MIEMENNDLLINQSLVKDLVKYQKKELCGLIFENKWVHHQYGQGTKSNNLGHYFEYLCTGALAKGELEPPKAEYTKKNELTSDYQVAKEQSEYFHDLVRKYGITLLSSGEKVIADNQWIGTLDIKAKWESVFENEIFDFDKKNTDKTVIIDLKYSGLLEDKWSEFGWNNYTLPKKQGTMLQAKHYKFLFWKKYGFNPPFFFWVFDSKNVGTAKIINVDISEYELKQHESFLIKAKAYYLKQTEIGFKPIPKYEMCQSCKYRNWCSFKTEVPEIINIKPE